MVFLGLLVIAVYITHENLARVLPFAAPALEAFVDSVNSWRAWVDLEAADLIVRLDEFVNDLLNG